MADSMKMRATVDGDVATIKVLINHPMETGMRKGPGGQPIPAHFIELVTVTVNGKTVMDAQWGTAISKNPLMEFKVKGVKVGDKVAINWADNKGEKDSIEAAAVKK